MRPRSESFLVSSIGIPRRRELSRADEGTLAALVPECGDRTVVALCAAEQCKVYWCHEVARHLAAHPPRANNGRVALPGALLSHLEPAARRSPSPVFFTRGAGEPLPSALLESYSSWSDSRNSRKLLATG